MTLSLTITLNNNNDSASPILGSLVTWPTWTCSMSWRPPGCGAVSPEEGQSYVEFHQEEFQVLCNVSNFLFNWVSGANCLWLAFPFFLLFSKLKPFNNRWCLKQPKSEAVLSLFHLSGLRVHPSVISFSLLCPHGAVLSVFNYLIWVSLSITI